jgi:hypothetical protein
MKRFQSTIAVRRHPTWATPISGAQCSLIIPIALSERPVTFVGSEFVIVIAQGRRVWEAGQMNCDPSDLQQVRPS